MEGNCILATHNGDPFLDSHHKPHSVLKEYLDSLGVDVGEPEKLEFTDDMVEKMNILANMVKGMTEAEAQEEFSRLCQEKERED